MKYSKFTSVRKTAARIAVAGAVMAIPVVAAAVPASADIPVTSPADVSRPWDRDDHHGRHDRDRDDRRHHNDCDRNDWRSWIPRAAFGSL